MKAIEFDIALLDINLPDGSGLDLCEEIRGRGQHTYIIFITANDKESDMLKGYEAGRRGLCDKALFRDGAVQKGGGGLCQSGTAHAPARSV